MFQCIIEWILTITSIIANVVVIIGIFSYLFNRPRTSQFTLADIQIGEVEDCLGNKDYRQQKIRLCFYNKTSTQFYIQRVNTHDRGVIKKTKYSDYEELIKVEENYSSIYWQDNGHNNPVMNICVQPNAPCIIEGYLILEADRLLPEEITLIVVTTTNKMFMYDINTDAQVVLSSKRIKQSRKAKR